MDRACHRGVVVGVGHGTVCVRIAACGACGACGAADVCGTREGSMKTVVVRYEGDDVGVGSVVDVAASDADGLRAVALAFVVPLATMLAALFTAFVLTGCEFFSVVAALTALLPYYLVLYVFRSWLWRCFRFSVKRVL